MCVVLYKETGGARRYAVLNRVKGWEGWELVKGHMEGNPDETARQEVKEETGIDELEQLEPLDHTMQWEYEDDGEDVAVTCECFLAEAPSDARVSVAENPHDEHADGYFLNFRDARDILTHDNQKELLDIAADRIENRDSR